MNDKFEKELKKLAKKYHMTIFFECSYCGHTHENLGYNGDDAYFITLVDKEGDYEQKSSR